jgi:hypothetical protein
MWTLCLVECAVPRCAEGHGFDSAEALQRCDLATSDGLLAYADEKPRAAGGSQTGRKSYNMHLNAPPVPVDVQSYNLHIQCEYNRTIMHRPMPVDMLLSLACAHALNHRGKYMQFRFGGTDTWSCQCLIGLITTARCLRRYIFHSPVMQADSHSMPVYTLGCAEKARLHSPALQAYSHSMAVYNLGCADKAHSPASVQPLRACTYPWTYQ